MTVQEIDDVILRASKLRVPRWQPDDRASDKVERLEDSMLACAHMRGDLEAARLHLRRSVARLEDQWDDVTGWEAIVSSRVTQREITMAKRSLRRDLYDGIRDGRRMLVELGDQLRRLELDEKVDSRAYTLLTGAA